LIGRPLLGWLTLPLVAIALSVLLTLQSRPSESSAVAEDGSGEPAAANQPSGIAWNHLEVTDVDLGTGLGRGFAWNVLYSHEGGLFDIDVRESPGLKELTTTGRRVLTNSFGYAGRAFGGIQIQADSGLPAYDVVMSAEGDARRRTQLRAVPIAPRSSKSFAAQYAFDADVDPTVRVRRRRGSDLLQGGLTNPLNVDLLDGMLVYRNWAYRLPTRLPAGGRIESLSELRQENFRWHLTRQKALESSNEAEPWDPSNFNDLLRVAEMLMFHRVVGGQRYTGLEDAPLQGLDFGDLLVQDRCVLIGRLRQPMTQLDLGVHVVVDRGDASATPIGVPPERSLSMIRVVIPIQQN
jgi:hypothetical protein